MLFDQKKMQLPPTKTLPWSLTDFVKRVTFVKIQANWEVYRGLFFFPCATPESFVNVALSERNAVLQELAETVRNQTLIAYPNKKVVISEKMFSQTLEFLDIEIQKILKGSPEYQPWLGSFEDYQSNREVKGICAEWLFSRHQSDVSVLVTSRGFISAWELDKNNPGSLSWIENLKVQLR